MRTDECAHRTAPFCRCKQQHYCISSAPLLKLLPPNGSLQAAEWPALPESFSLSSCSSQWRRRSGGRPAASGFAALGGGAGRRKHSGRASSTSERLLSLRVCGAEETAASPRPGAGPAERIRGRCRLFGLVYLFISRDIGSFSANS